MKKIFFYISIAATALITFEKSVAQNANTSLSNLTSPTNINANLLPGKDHTHSLGSPAKEWKNIYLDSAVYFDRIKFLSYTAGSNLANTAVGFYALSSNTYGSYNTASGYSALNLNTSGSENSATGAYALHSNTGGANNTANGYEALYSNTTGNYNVAMGYTALSSNQTGYDNTANGVQALASNFSGFKNTAIGYQALLENNESFNTAVGSYALYQTTASEFNTAVGYDAGDTYNNGYNNVFIGANTDVNGANYFNDIAIGQDVTCTDVSQARIGNSATVSIGGYADWSNISDGRVKRNIKQNVPGLTFINKLQPITYNLDLEAADKIIQAPQRKDSAGKNLQSLKFESDAKAAKEKILYTGFVAQDVEKAAKSLNYDFSGVDAAKNDKDLYGLRYGSFVVPLVKAVQELSKMNDAKDSAMKEMQNNYDKKINILQNEIDELKNMITSSTNHDQQTTSLSSVSLQQNIPNPFSNTTTINYSLPQIYSSAKIIITNSKGDTIKQINLNIKGKGSVQVDASTLSSGAYQYTLYVDGKVIAAKQMISAK